MKDAFFMDFEFTMHQRYVRPRVWFPEIIEVEQSLLTDTEYCRRKVIMLSLNLSFGLESLKTVPVLLLYNKQISRTVFPLSKFCNDCGK
ncbi:hypothetical protein [Desulfosporosinus sp.]|uniref:hypothetical protein n=1 Tax=Desulfosporosinus sp. TaxID=157907 RepID=UPI0025BD023C|nr:hypothetical protein [Desulfosporosinus sp.]MBC2726969.1 hypothetical protein [Desulfosporosinus sp.]